MPSVKPSPTQEKPWLHALLIVIAIGYLALVLLIPAANVIFQAFHKGVVPFVQNLLAPDFLHAAWLTFALALVVVPLNTVFGLCAAWAIAAIAFRDVPCCSA